MEVLLELYGRGECESDADVRESHSTGPYLCGRVYGPGIAYWLGWINQWSEYDSTTLDRAMQLEQQAIALDDGNARAHAILGRLYIYKRQFEKAVAEGERSIELAPNSAVNNWWLSAILNRSGKPAESISFAEKAARLDPRNRDLYEFDIGLAYLVMGRYEEAIPFFKTNLVH